MNVVAAIEMAIVAMFFGLWDGSWAFFGSVSNKFHVETFILDLRKIWLIYDLFSTNSKKLHFLPSKNTLEIGNTTLYNVFVLILKLQYLHNLVLSYIGIYIFLHFVYQLLPKQTHFLFFWRRKEWYFSKKSIWKNMKIPENISPF